MSEWGEISLGEGCEILDSLRVPLNADERDNIKGDVPYYGANGLQGYINKAIFDEPLILLAEDGGYFDEYETRPIAYRISGPSWVNNHAHILRVKKDGELDQDFTFYCLQHKNITPFIKGGTRAKLNQSELRGIVVPKPPPNAASPPSSRPWTR
jgi:type I restriction enzyme S subunit